MYGYDGNMSAAEWLALTGDPMSLTEQDRKRLGIERNANANQEPSEITQPTKRAHPVDD